MNCYVCSQERPCCGSHLSMMFHEHHTGHSKEVLELSKAWGMGRVMKNCCGFHGEYIDVETKSIRVMFLGLTEEEVLQYLCPHKMQFVHVMEGEPERKQELKLSTILGNVILASLCVQF